MILLNRMIIIHYVQGAHHASDRSSDNKITSTAVERYISIVAQTLKGQYNQN